MLYRIELYIVQLYVLFLIRRNIDVRALVTHRVAEGEIAIEIKIKSDEQNAIT